MQEGKEQEVKTADQILTDIDKLSIADKLKVAYGLAVESNYRKGLAFASEFVMWLDGNGLANDMQSKSGRVDDLISILLATSKLIEAAMAEQARTELQVATEESQFGAELANEMHTFAMQVEKLAEDLTVDIAHYSAVLEGRRNNIHYTSDEGNNTPVAAG